MRCWELGTTPPSGWGEGRLGLYTLRLLPLTLQPDKHRKKKTAKSARAQHSLTSFFRRKQILHGITHRLDGEEFREVGLRVSEEGAVSVGMVRETLRPLATFRTRQQDSDLRRPNMIREVFIGCRRPRDSLKPKKIQTLS